jgi:hypothetical protein
MKNNHNHVVALSDQRINAFWEWFLGHHREVEVMLDRDQTVELSEQINKQIDHLSSNLAWEIGPGLVQPYMLAFPTAGDIDLKAVVQRILERAPRIARWEFHASRPTRSFQPEVQLPDLGLSFRSADWRFALDPSPTSERLSLQVFDDKLASVDEKTALTAIFVLLDAALGEDMVERWIGGIKVLPSRAGEKSLPMPEIAKHLVDLVS